MTKIIIEIDDALVGEVVDVISRISLGNGAQPGPWPDAWTKYGSTSPCLGCPNYMEGPCHCTVGTQDIIC